MPLTEVESQVIYDRTANLQKILTAWGRQGWEQASLDCDMSASGNITDQGRMRLVLKRVTDIPVQLKVHQHAATNIDPSWPSPTGRTNRSTVPDGYSFR